MRHLYNAHMIAALALCTMICSCKKKDQTATTPAISCSIKSSGSFFEAEPVNFSLDPVVTGRIYWDMGDNSTDSGLTVAHTYAKSGSYTVKVTVYGDNAQTVNQSITINPNTRKAFLVSGAKSWHETYYYSSSGNPPVNTNLPDTSFGFSYIDSAHISSGADTLSYKTSVTDTLTTFDVTKNDITGISTYKSVQFYSRNNAVVYKIYYSYPGAVKILTYTAQ